MLPGDGRRGVWGSRRRSISLVSRTSAGRPSMGGSGCGASRYRSGCGRSLQEVNDQLKRRRHQPIPEQGKWLRSVVQGHIAYYAVPGNTDAVAAFRAQVSRRWYKALRRRSQRKRLELEADGPSHHEVATTRPRAASLSRRAIRRQNPRQEPSAVIPHAGICAGGRSQGRSLPRFDLGTGPPLHLLLSVACEPRRNPRRKPPGQRMNRPGGSGLVSGVLDTGRAAAAGRPAEVAA